MATKHRERHGGRSGCGGERRTQRHRSHPSVRDHSPHSHQDRRSRSVAHEFRTLGADCGGARQPAHADARRQKLIPTRLQSVAESLYDLVFGMTQEVLGPQGRAYFPFIFTLFAFILAANLLGLIPGAFTVTSHIIMTLALALMVFIGATVIGFIKHGTGYLKLFMPAGVPPALFPSSCRSRSSPISSAPSACRSGFSRI